ncbi:MULTISPECIES: toxin-antitoxin system HicB family antitoxin [Lysinibacillus]|uniref:Toxin-antitoxin system HicB family antitoxin n=1 Tax=Lysinibacillus irui TaxID=2998077 RepID=A0AAJ5UTC2_9BACI|nr:MULTISPECIES: toxin-antitoxin system HicB family antitoxin [Lysinibacillus]WDV05065.1 toxin-antitoxin system HicB family antitoxin [Lysinibacillus irui]
MERENEIDSGKISILVPISIVAFIISILAILFQSILGDSQNLATIIGGSLGMLGGIVGVIGAYIVAKTQIDYQAKQVLLENKKKARPYIVCNDFQANVKLQGVNVHQDSKIIEFDYYEKLKLMANTLSGGRIGFFQLKFIGTPEVILECEIKLYLDKKHYKPHFYEAYLDHMKNDVEIYIPIPFAENVNGLQGKPEKLKMYYTTTEYEKFLYIYNFKENYEQLYQVAKGKEYLVKQREFLETSWILPGKKRNVGIFNMSIPDSLRKQLIQEANKEGVSFNQYIIYKLSK